MSTVGIIANPAAGKDIRRLVAHGRFVSNQEKVNTLRRILTGLDAVGVERVVMMPESAMLGRAAVEDAGLGLDLRLVEMTVFDDERDSTRAAELMSEMGVGCLVTLGGDGTNRAVARGLGDIPLLAVSTGTNNVFPAMVEGTVAGLAAGVVACHLVEADTVTEPHGRLEVHVDGALRDIALVDVAISTEAFVGARALWDIEKVHEIILVAAKADSIGLSAIGAQLDPDSGQDGRGRYIRIGPGDTKVAAPIAPGLVAPVPVAEWRPMALGESVEISLRPCTVALDGERSFSLNARQRGHCTLSDRGPRVVSVEKTLREAARRGVFLDCQPASASDQEPS